MARNEPPEPPASEPRPPDGEREPDDTRELFPGETEEPAADDTRESAVGQASADDDTRELPPSTGPDVAWAGRATVRPPDRHPHDTQEWEALPEQRRGRWLMPALATLVGLLLAGVLGFGVYLIVQATGGDRVAPVAPSPTGPSTPSPEPAEPTREPTVPSPVTPPPSDPPVPTSDPNVPEPTAPEPTEPSPEPSPTDPEPSGSPDG